MLVSCGVNFMDNFPIGQKLLWKIAFSTAASHAVRLLWHMYG